MPQILDYLEFCDCFPAAVSHCWKAWRRPRTPQRQIRGAGPNRLIALAAISIVCLRPEDELQVQRMSLETFNKFSGSIDDYSEIELLDGHRLV